MVNTKLRNYKLLAINRYNAPVLGIRIRSLDSEFSRQQFPFKIESPVSIKKAIPLKRDRLSRTSKNHHCCYFVVAFFATELFL